ncbi:MAG: hypothetical protein J3K34DRAFT_61146 [Monoraphidium minutum]|nr:MAG: hypothetical protein J3K34DRAFT_61146 [Monoraphidium minutum]
MLATGKVFARPHIYHAAPRRPLRMPTARSRLAWRAAAAEPAKPDLDAELEKQLDAILRELDPDGLVNDAEELALLETAEGEDPARPQSGAAASTSGAAGAAPARARGRGRRKGPRSPLGVAAAAEAEAEAGEGTPVHMDGLPEGFTLTLGEQRRKGAILLELLQAGQNLEGKLAQFRGEVDDVLVLLMRRRLETALEMEEGPEAVAAYESLYSLLRRERARAAASPAMRLLDDVLEALGDDTDAPDYPERRRRAAGVMRDAFTGGALPVDVFTAAAALAQDGPLAAEALSIEAVQPIAFLAEASELLEESKRQLRDGQEAVSRFQAELAWAQQHRPELLEAPDVKKRIRAMQQAEAQLDPRAEAVGQLEDVLKIAANLDLGAPPPGFGGP